MIHLKSHSHCIPLMLICMLNIVCTSSDSSTKWPTAGWEVTTATSQGMNYDSLYAFSAKLASGDLGYIDGMLVIRNGMIVFEKEYTNNYDSLFKTTGTKLGKYNYYDPLWHPYYCLLYTSPSPRDGLLSRMPSSA